MTENNGDRLFLSIVAKWLASKSDDDDDDETKKNHYSRLRILSNHISATIYLNESVIVILLLLRVMRKEESCNY